MKRHEIKRLFNSAVGRLKRSLGSLPSVYQGHFNYILRNMDYDFDSHDVTRMVEQFANELDDMACWMDNIFPDDPTYKDKQYKNRVDRAIEFAEERLDKIKELIA